MRLMGLKAGRSWSRLKDGMQSGRVQSRPRENHIRPESTDPSYVNKRDRGEYRSRAGGLIYVALRVYSAVVCNGGQTLFVQHGHDLLYSIQPIPGDHRCISVGSLPISPT